MCRKFSCLWHYNVLRYLVSNPPSYKVMMYCLHFAELCWQVWLGQRRGWGGRVGPEAEFDGGVGSRMCACGGKHFSCWISAVYLQAMIGRKASSICSNSTGVSKRLLFFYRGQKQTKEVLLVLYWVIFYEQLCITSVFTFLRCWYCVL